MGYRIFTDATADMNADMLAGIPEIEIIPMEVNFGEESFTFGPGGNLSVAQFYAMQREGRFANTSQINPEIYRECFERALRRGEDVLYLCFSSGMSGTIDNARISVEALQKAYPEREIIVLDTLCASVGEGFLTREAARKQAEGLDLHALRDWVMESRLKVCHWFTVDTFTHLKHGGRVSGAVAAIGSVLNIKPLLHVDEAGKLDVAQKPRGRKQALKAQLAHMENGWLKETGPLVIIGHGDNREAADELAGDVRAKYPDAQIIISEIGPIIGAHTGPGMLALIYWGVDR